MRNRLGDDFLRPIESVDLSHAPDVDLAKLRNLSGLRKLMLVGVELENDDFTHLERIATLEELSLDFTNTSDSELAEHLTRLPNLRSLDLYGTSVSDTGIESLKSLSRLEYVRLYYTRITDSGVAELQASLPSCRVVHQSTFP